MSFKHLAFRMDERKESSSVARKKVSIKLVKGHMLGKVYLSHQGLTILNRWGSSHD
jgi:hypothetical protein